MSVTGEPGGRPVRPGLSLGDIAAGLYAAIGILAAVREREASGLGQFVDISMLDCQIAIQENAFMRYHVTGEAPVPLGTRHPSAVPFQAFQTADGYLVIALAWGVPNQWHLLCAELGMIEIAEDPRFETAAARSANHAALEPLLQTALPQEDDRRLAGAAAGVRDPLRPAEHDSAGGGAAAGGGAGDARAGGAPHDRARAARRHSGAALSHAWGDQGFVPDMGQHSREVLRELLGLSDAEIEALVGREVVREERAPIDLG